MNILYLTFDFPFPPNSGSTIRDFNTIRILSKYHDVYWITRTLKKDISESSIKEMKKYCTDMLVIPWNYKHSLIAFVKSYLLNKPYKIIQYKSKYCENILSDYISSHKIDLILCDHIYVAQYLPQNSLNIPVIAGNEDTCFNYFLKLKEMNNCIMSLYGRTQWKKMLNYETKIYSKYLNFVTTSDLEKEAILKYTPNINVHVLKNAVDLNAFKCMERTDFTKNIVFTGWYAYYPNEDAVLHFVKNIYPLIKEKLNDVKFYIIGKDPTKKILRLNNSNNIIVTGEVKDVKEYLRNADVFVAPIRVGAGTRNKILEAMAMGIPVVSSNLGAEGIGAKHMENILLTDSNEDFARNVINLMVDKDLSKKISINSQRFIKENYDWDKISITFIDFINKIAADFKESHSISN